ncbi:MAG: cytochrome c3 family protein [Polyangiaceae bacterium]
MKHVRLLPLVVVVFAVIGACSDHTPPRFPHEHHLANMDCGGPGKPDCLNCNDCHSVAQKDRAHRLPDKAKCEHCHRDDAHQVLEILAAPPQRRAGAIRFDHPKHLAMEGIKGQCVRCHGGVVIAGEPPLPPMSKCFACHEHEKQWQNAQCLPCHESRDLKQTMPQTFLRHDASFVRRHGQFAVQEGPLCQSCHSRSQCDDCHDVTQNLTPSRRMPEKLERGFIHRGDFMVRHAIEAQHQSARCMSCHTTESCDACHIARGVSQNRVRARSPHPPGWVGGNPDSRSFHGREARRDIVLCASCHERGPATNCIGCHKVGAYGGNPHPSGWKSARSESAAMCRYCHE